MEKIRVEEEKNNLIDSTISVGEQFYNVHHELLLVMIDGKVCNAITDTNSTQKCYICGATSKMFNSIESMITREVRKDVLEFGLSILHGWIRFFECLLHLAYKIPIKNGKFVLKMTKKMSHVQSCVSRKSLEIELV